MCINYPAKNMNIIDTSTSGNRTEGEGEGN